MPSDQECIFQASRIVGLVADDLFEFTGHSVALLDLEIVDLVTRLDVAVDLIRSANGGAG